MDPTEYFRTSTSVGYFLEVKCKFDDDEKMSVIDMAIVKIQRYAHPVRFKKAFYMKVLRNESLRHVRWKKKHQALPLAGVDVAAPPVELPIDPWPERVKGQIGFRPKDRDCRLLEELFVKSRNFEELGPDVASSPSAARARFYAIRRKARELKSGVKPAI
jgi:hypothetical protein